MNNRQDFGGGMLMSCNLAFNHVAISQYCHPTLVIRIFFETFFDETCNDHLCIHTEHKGRRIIGKHRAIDTDVMSSVLFPVM